MYLIFYIFIWYPASLSNSPISSGSFCEDYSAHWERVPKQEAPLPTYKEHMCNSEKARSTRIQARGLSSRHGVSQDGLFCYSALQLLETQTSAPVAWDARDGGEALSMLLDQHSLPLSQAHCLPPPEAMWLWGKTVQQSHCPF